MKQSLENAKNIYNETVVPKEALERMQKGIKLAKMEEKQEKKKSNLISLKRTAIGIAAAFAVCFVSVNSSQNVAYAMEKLPLVGKLFQVMTIREYESDSVTAKVPEIQEKSEATEYVNKDAAQYIDELLEKFEADCKENGEAYQSLDVSYQVLADTEKYFSLDIVGTQTQASGYEFHKFYTIDKATDELLTLDKFYAGKEYIAPVSEEIIRQMKEDEDQAYFIGEQEEDFEGFTEITPDQKFYVNENGNVVIAFDEYEVGPGSVGAPRFEIAADVVK